jgi:hypothetical protein
MADLEAFPYGVNSRLAEMRSNRKGLAHWLCDLY